MRLFIGWQKSNLDDHFYPLLLLTQMESLVFLLVIKYKSNDSDLVALLSYFCIKNDSAKSVILNHYY